MRISIVCVGKIKEKYLKDGILEYSKRLSRFCDLEIIEVEDEQIPERPNESQCISIKKNEAIKINKKLKDNIYVIVLDVKGYKMNSEELAAKLSSICISGYSNIAFIIGGSIGLDKDIINRANLKLSFSDFTFPHQLMRLILLEQIFRSFKINGNETYHK